MHKPLNLKNQHRTGLVPLMSNLWPMSQTATQLLIVIYFHQNSSILMTYYLKVIHRNFLCPCVQLYIYVNLTITDFWIIIKWSLWCPYLTYPKCCGLALKSWLRLVKEFVFLLLKIDLGKGRLRRRNPLMRWSYLLGLMSIDRDLLV